jgi:predicted 3-demethylubiquinone-9 3-methyltransferase (glyoxalase superfamily)
MQSKITPFLWYDGKAEEAIKLYTSIFKNSKIINLAYWAEGTPFPKNQVMMATFEIDGQRFHAFDAGPQFKFNEAISLFVSCDSQEEIDHYWNSLTANGGEESQCGWLKDKFGISWQIVPSILGDMLQNKDKAPLVMQAVMKMKKFIIADLKAAVGEK